MSAVSVVQPVIAAVHSPVTASPGDDLDIERITSIGDTRVTSDGFTRIVKE